MPHKVAFENKKLPYNQSTPHYMKLLRQLSYAFLLITIFTFSQCKKNKKDEPQLPPETTIGAMTFGCKIDEKVFVPRDGGGKPGLYVQYVNLGNGIGGGWFLNISTYDYENKKGIHIETDSLLLEEGMTYEFKNQKGSPIIFYEQVKDGSTEIYGKQSNDSGILIIKRHDRINRILSGTFSFTGTNLSTGEKVNVTDGSLDIRY